MSPDLRQSWLFAALTMILMGFFMVWLPHEAAGLSFIGLEMGEQAKFLPQVRSGEIFPGRSLFYTPPIVVGLILVLVSSRWPIQRWKTWVARALGPAASLLAFPAFEALGAEAEEWSWRVLMIAAVFLLASLSFLVVKLPVRAHWALVALAAACGALLPTWVFLEVRSAFSVFHRAPLGIGAGFWLNLFGNLFLVILALLALREQHVQWRAAP